MSKGKDKLLSPAFPKGVDEVTDLIKVCNDIKDKCCTFGLLDLIGIFLKRPICTAIVNIS